MHHLHHTGKPSSVILLVILQVCKLAIIGPAAALANGCRYVWSCMQLVWGALLAGARLAPTVQQTAMDAGSQVSFVKQSTLNMAAL